jgi:hypothetical protein
VTQHSGFLPSPTFVCFCLSFRECGALYTLLPQSRLEKNFVSKQTWIRWSCTYNKFHLEDTTRYILFSQITRIFIDSTLAGYVNSIAIINLIKAESTWMRRDCYRY